MANSGTALHTKEGQLVTTYSPVYTLLTFIQLRTVQLKLCRSGFK